MRRLLPSLLLTAAASPAALAQPREVGNLVIDGVPPIPPAVLERMTQYANTRDAAIAEWDPAGGMYVLTRFGEVPQVHHVAAPLGARRQLTFFAEPISGVHVLPGREKEGFIFRMDAGGGEFFQYYWVDLARGTRVLITDGKSRNESLAVANRGPRFAYVSTRRNGKDFDLWIGDGTPGGARLVKELEGQWAVRAWSPDDARLLVSKYVSINESHLHVFDVASGQLHAIDARPGEAIARTAGGFLRGGRAVVFGSDEGSDHKRLVIVDLASGKKEIVSPPNLGWDVGEIEVSRDGKWLAYAVNEGGTGVVYLAPAARPARAAKLALPRGVVGGMEFDPASRRLGLTLSTSASAADVYGVDVATRKVTRWTESEVGGLPASIFVEPALIEYDSFDGRRVPAYVYRPRNGGGKKLPVVIYIHGGPESQFKPAFSATLQYYVNELGVAVIAPNVRGSAGYGKGYLLLDNGMKREDSVKDIGALLDWIATQPDLDASRVGVTGGSYGGYMVLASLAAYPERIRCGVDVVGISSFVTFLEGTEAYRRDLRRAEYGDERDPGMREFLTRISPLTNASKIRSPLFVIQGQNDPRVPIGEAEQIVKTVRAQRGEASVWYLVARDEGHGFKRKTNKDFYLAATSLFFQRHLID
jgi:dipeptidyl aminopeptidase/acylaminoacyl peptidase